MDTASLLRAAERWRAVALCIGAVAFVAVFGSGTLFPWQASLVAVVLVLAVVAIVHFKLTFERHVRLADSEISAVRVADVLRPKYHHVRVSMRRDGSLRVQTNADSPNETRVERSQGGELRLISPPPAMGELSQARLRRRLLEWATISDELERGFGDRHDKVATEN